MKKAIKTIVSIVFVLVIVCGSFVGCSSTSHDSSNSGGYFFPDKPKFSTRYTIEQHKERITRVFAEQENSKYFDYFYVDIVYSFRNKPEFFLVEHGYALSNSNVNHTAMGCIIDDNYYLISEDDYITRDLSCFRKKGFINNKKYFGKYKASKYNPGYAHEGICAVEVNGEIIGICGELENKVISEDMINKLLYMQTSDRLLFIKEEELVKYCSSIKPREEPLFFSPMVDYSLTVDTIEQYLEKRRLSDRPYIIDDLYDKKGNQIYKLVEFEDDGYMIFDVSGSNPVLKDFSPNTASPYKKYEQVNGKITSKKIYDPSDMLDREMNGCSLWNYTNRDISNSHVLNYRSSWGYVTGRRIQVISSEGTTTPFFWPEEKNTLIVFREVE
ncbi:MAG: hypothetical protein J6B79_05335 [Clostridia bacterium]|nr:hypothetical protein [Clostridia bacterium]